MPHPGGDQLSTADGSRRSIEVASILSPVDLILRPRPRSISLSTSSSWEGPAAADWFEDGPDVLRPHGRGKRPQRNLVGCAFSDHYAGTWTRRIFT